MSSAIQLARRLAAESTAAAEYNAAMATIAAMRKLGPDKAAPVDNLATTIANVRKLRPSPPKKRPALRLVEK